jgi:hypothetical protein
VKVTNREPEGFVEFWSIWQPHARNTDGRGLARETFRKHVLNGAEPQDIIDGASWFIRNLNERTREYVPLSATWLNREAYLDFAPKEREFQAKLAARADLTNVVPIKPAPTYVSAFMKAWSK